MLRRFACSVTPRTAGVVLLLAAVAAVVGSSQFQAAHAAGPTLPARIGGVVPTVGHQVQGSGDLINHGGPVMTTNKTYAIYWVPVGSSMPAGYQSTINQFFTDVAHDSGMSSNVYASDTQYSSIQYSSTFAGSTVATTAFPSNGCPVYSGVTRCLTDAQLQNEINTVIGSQGWVKNGTTQFFLFTPQSLGSCFGSLHSSGCAYTDYCAYHGFANGGFIYANQPYADVSNCRTTPAQYPNSNPADPTINVTSHEHNEAITDPQLNAWYDAAGFENGDKCAWDFGAVSGSNGAEYNQTINGHHYFLQREYSNNGHACVQTYQIQGGGSAPTVTSFTPTTGPVGTSVSITGANFTGVTGVSFGNVAASTFAFVSDSNVTATVPTGAVTAPIKVTTGNGTGTSSTNFTVTTGGGNPPTVTSFTPASGPVGTSVSITGTNFTGLTGVSFGGVAATTTNFVSDTNVTATVPTGAVTGHVAVSTGNGTGQSSGNFTVTTSGTPPKITSFSPQFGRAGALINISGSGFTGATSVKLGAVSASFVVQAGGLIRATVPAMGVGLYKWQVTTPAGTATSTGSFFHQ
jgi:IPT/TIG domain